MKQKKKKTGIGNEDIIRDAEAAEENSVYGTQQTPDGLDNEGLPDIVENTIKFVIFTLDASRYAIAGTDVLEIIIGNEIYPMPFMPAYIRGLINRHGIPYAAADLNLLFRNKKLDADRYIVLRDDAARLSFLVTAVEQIISMPESAVHTLAESEAAHGYFSATLRYLEEEVPVVDSIRIFKTITNDFAQQ